MCPPPLWAHRQRRIVWQSNMSSKCVLLHMVMSLETKPGKVYFCTCRIFPTHYISFLLVVRAVAPFVSQAKWPPWQGVWAAATINTVGMRSLGWRRPLLHANPLGHRGPAYLLKGCTCTKALCPLTRCGVRCVSAPSWGGGGVDISPQKLANFGGLKIFVCQCGVWLCVCRPAT